MTSTTHSFPRRRVQPLRCFGFSMALLASSLLTACSETPAVEDGKQVSIVYQAKTIEGDLVDANPEGGPIVFVVGTGKLQPAVEAKLIGMREGEEKIFAIEDAYGSYDEGKTGLMNRGSMPEDVEVGDHIQMANGVPSVVKEVNDLHVILDLNHPLAGKEIVFTVRVVDVSDSSEGSSSS